VKKDWKAVHKLLDALKDVKDTSHLYVYISVHQLRDAEIDDVASKVPPEFKVKEDSIESRQTGWVKARTNYDALGFKGIELTMFFGSYSKAKHEARQMSKGGDKE